MQGQEQAVCKGLCPLGNLSGEKRCSCTKMFGPIQIIAPCEWEIIETPTCKPSESDESYVTTTTVMPTTIMTTSVPTTVFSTAELEPAIPAMPSGFDFQDFGRMLLGSMMPEQPQMVTKSKTTKPTTPKTSPTPPMTQAMSNRPVDSNTKMDPRELYNKVRRKEDKICKIKLPQHNLWRCNSDKMIKGTICKYR